MADHLARKYAAIQKELKDQADRDPRMNREMAQRGPELIMERLSKYRADCVRQYGPKLVEEVIAKVRQLRSIEDLGKKVRGIRPGRDSMVGSSRPRAEGGVGGHFCPERTERERAAEGATAQPECPKRHAACTLSLSGSPERSLRDEEGDNPPVPRLREYPQTRRQSGGSGAKGARCRGRAGGRAPRRVERLGGRPRRGQEVAAVQAVGRESLGRSEACGTGSGQILKPKRSGDATRAARTTVRVWRRPAAAPREWPAGRPPAKFRGVRLPRPWSGCGPPRARPAATGRR